MSVERDDFKTSGSLINPYDFNRVFSLHVINPEVGHFGGTERKQCH